ncbi:unnamed protein product [Caenorhabditis angaria]|uniref:Guanylate cyclase n=1 Tax=Caenorhabditis angaria TaxID=860376 RepID=A0A9P1I583_9PELO|nr:unnamed protein product [Caenorhabditis angaria]
MTTLRMILISYLFVLLLYPFGNRVFCDSIIDGPFKIVVALPKNAGNRAKNHFQLSMPAAIPVIDLAIKEVYKRRILPYGSLNISYIDTNLSDVLGPVRVIDKYAKDEVDAIFGFAYAYSLAPIARYSAHWGNGKPVITTIGLAEDFGDRAEFQFLTRMMGSYSPIGDIGKAFFLRNNYTSCYFFIDDKVQIDDSKNNPKSEYLFGSSVLKVALMKEYKFSMAHKFLQMPSVDDSHDYFKDILREGSFYSNVIILCASPDTVRRIMLAAHELGMATSGQYVFINIDVSTGNYATKPWHRNNDTKNEEAKIAYRALKTISLRRSNKAEYAAFETTVKNLAESKYNYTIKHNKPYEMNNFISAFYDAVMLYAIAVNETIEAGMNPRDGKNITKKMWGRKFKGIVGDVSIDENGDRYSDYSLLDMDPEKSEFVEVAYYSGSTERLETVGAMHWVNGKPPSDWPICGYDKSKCPQGYPLHYYLLFGSFLLILILVCLFVFFWRRYKLEQELAAMSWKIRWEELDGEESQKKEKKKLKKKKNHDGFLPESDPLLRSTSRSSVNSDKFDEESLLPMRIRLRSSSSGATRKISAMIDRKLSIFTRKKSSPMQSDGSSQKNGGLTPNSLKQVENGECSPLNEVQFRLPLNDRRVSSPSSNSDPKKKNSNEEESDNQAKKSLSLKNRKLSFGMVSFKSGSGGSVETIAQNNTQIYTKTAVYKGVVVAIKKLNIDHKRYPRLDLSRQQLMELKKMKDLQHDHITRFTGACIDFPHYCIVTEYCPKGSLEDILENEKIELDKMMKYSLLHDLVKGLFFLHNSEIRSHGRLKSSNCVVDSRFVLKVTDFGLHKLHSLEETSMEEMGEHAFYKRMLWTAPELLRISSPPPMGTQKGDIYSFAIILHEMMFRRGVFAFENEEMSPIDVISRVKKPVESDDEEPLRPWVPDNSEGDDALNDTLLSLMVTCWSEDPHDRPEVSHVRKAVRSLNRDNETSNLVDNLLKRMEQYANNLEGLVEERTQEYLAEKKKVEDLLHQLLPPTVADQLIMGQAVQAESYDCVTIYFSDIVGFTSLSSQSTPMQVVTLLNDLYLAFDGVVDNFKVYKVETIGDAYMVVSGLPEERDDHASQIAQMSLALLHKVKNFVIRHRPHEQLKLRIGMHSGSVVSGVVGSKMPRYCLFGDTVNTSSRMESNGLPLRIHVSQQTHEILTRDDNSFRLELRGTVEMKGKGMQTTYWLKGYKEIEIPDFGEQYR